MAKHKKDGILDTVMTVVWALLIAGVFRTVLFQPFSIPSGSMKPTLLVGDYLFVSKFAYGYSRYSLPFAPDLFDGRIWAAEPRRGDVVVFKHPRHDQCAEGPIETVVNFGKALIGQGYLGESDCVDYVKRVVGLPGDRIQVIAGILHVNGEPVDLRRLPDFTEPKQPLGSPPRSPRCTNEPVALGGECRKEAFLERFDNGNEHVVLNREGQVGAVTNTRFPDTTGVYEVPEGHFFFMGDNRDNSVDSRFPEVGYVPFENLLGRADRIAISSAGAFWEVWNWRFGRSFKSIE